VILQILFKWERLYYEYNKLIINYQQIINKKIGSFVKHTSNLEDLSVIEIIGLLKIFEISY